jgi:chaperonin cofactor prefoldin
MFSESTSESTDEINKLIEAMERQIDDQNIEILKLKKQIENLKSLLISLFPQCINAVLKYV